MAISRRVVALSLGLAAAAGLALSAVVSPSSEPELVRPVEINRPDQQDGDGATGPLPDVPSEPVPVVPRVDRRDADARPVVEDDDDDETSRRRGDADRGGGGDDDDGTDDGGGTDDGEHGDD
jgi:hypothetical protein